MSACCSYSATVGWRSLGGGLGRARWVTPVVLWEVAGGVDRADCVSAPVWIAVCRELAEVFTPSADELAWVQARTISEHHRLALLALLLCYKRLGFFRRTTTTTSSGR
jgi:hypothetical protein